MKIERQTCWAMALALGLSTGAAAKGLAPCEDPRFGERAECGTVEVLEDRTDPESRKIDLNVVVMRAEKPAGREPVFFLAGGPGQGATDLAGLALGVFEPVRESRDFVLVDQRGTGASNPLICSNNASEHPQSSFDGLFDPDNFARCLADFRQHAEVELYSTPHVVADLEEVRERLGYERVLLWGGSGGTRTALVWMRLHPDRIAATLIDGVTPTTFRAPSGMARGSHDALSRVFEDCAAQPSCREAFPELDDDFRKLLWIFEAGPVATHVKREDGTQVPVKMTRGGLGYAIRGMLYSSRRAKTLPNLIHASAQSGDVSPFAQALWLRDVNLRPVVSMGVHFAVYCTEDIPFIDEREVPALTDGTFLGTWLLEQYGAICDLWDAEPLGRDYLQPTTGDTPTLVFSGYYDPSTPSSYGTEVASHLTDSRHVIVRNEAHGAGFGCGRQAAIDFLSRASLEGLGPICEEVGPIEFDTP